MIGGDRCPTGVPALECRNLSAGALDPDHVMPGRSAYRCAVCGWSVSRDELPDRVRLLGLPRAQAIARNRRRIRRGLPVAVLGFLVVYGGMAFGHPVAAAVGCAALWGGLAWASIGVCRIALELYRSGVHRIPWPG